MLSDQNLKSWQRAPIQGAITTPHQSPLTEADEAYLQETLVECRVKLESALSTAKGYTHLPDLGIALADALTGCNEALSVLNDPKTYLE